MTSLEQTSPKIVPNEQRRAKNAFNISVATAIVFGIILVLTILVNRSLTVDFVSLLIVTIGAVAATLSARLSRRGKSDLGILILIGSLILIVVSRVFVQKGLAIPTGIVHIILVASIAIYTLTPKWVTRAIVAAFINAIFTIIVDQFTVGVPVSPNPEFAITISLVLGIAYLLVLATQFPTLPLRGKLVIGFLLLTTLPLFILGWQTNRTTRAILEEQIRANILEKASATSADIQEFVEPQISLVRNQARLTEIVEYMSLSQSQKRGSAKEILVYEKLIAISKNDPIYIRSYALIDANGLNVLDTNPANIGTNHANEGFFTYVTANGKPYVSGLIISPETDEQNIYFATPINSKSDQLIGVFVVTYNARQLQSLVDQLVRDGQVPPTENMYLIDGDNFFVLGHTSRVDLLFKSYLSADDPRLAILMQQGAINPDNLDSTMIPHPEMVAALSEMDATANFRAPITEYDGELAELAASRVPNTNWIVISTQPVSAVTTLIQSQTQGTVRLIIVITILAAIAAILVSNFFTSPLLQLTRVAENISDGDFTQKAAVRTQDEIGVLGSTFNKMSTQIQELVAGLEQRVEQRTSELAQTSKQSERRAQQLQTISEISRYVSTEKDLQTLLPLVTRVVSERFGFYHVGIFLLDETGRYAVLRASNSPGGQEMLLRQHRLEVGQTGIVGNVTSTGRPRIALDTGADAIYFNNPNLPDTRSEMALPLTARGKTIGALDVQSTEPNAFTEADVSILELLADQVAIAIDNARLIEEAQSALAESQSIFNEYIAEAWQKKTGAGVLGYHQTLSGGTVITDATTFEQDKAHSNGDKSLEVPIRVRNQVIGMLNIRSVAKDRDWSTDDINVVQAVVERLGLALDNARLFEETSARASRERLVTEITTRIRGTNNPQDMIKTAVDELQRALGATRVEIVPQKIAPPPDK